MGRHSIKTRELCEEICRRVANGESLRAICASPGMPDRQTILNWLEVDADFSAIYARARVAQADYMDDLILETANRVEEDNAQSARVKIMAYQWRAARLKPKVYGDKLELEHSGKLAVVSDQPLSEEEWNAAHSVAAAGGAAKGSD